MKKNLLYNISKVNFTKLLWVATFFLLTVILLNSCKQHSNLPKQKEANNSKVNSQSQFANIVPISKFKKLKDKEEIKHEKQIST